MNIKNKFKTIIVAIYCFFNVLWNNAQCMETKKDTHASSHANYNFSHTEQRTREYAEHLGISNASGMSRDELQREINKVKQQRTREYAERLGISNASDMPEDKLLRKIDKLKEQREEEKKTRKHAKNLGIPNAYKISIDRLQRKIAEKEKIYEKIEEKEERRELERRARTKENKNSFKENFI